MMTDSSISFVYRIRPLSTITQRALYVVPAVAVAVWVRPHWPWGFVFGGIASVFLVHLGMTRTITLVVQGGTLVVVRRPLMRLFGRFETYAACDIRRVRYRTESHQRSDSYNEREWIETHYFLDVVLLDGGIHILLKTVDAPFRRRLGRQLADALQVAYEEHVSDESL